MRDDQQQVPWAVERAPRRGRKPFICCRTSASSPPIVEPPAFPDYLQLSSNYHKPGWHELRRLEWPRSWSGSTPTERSRRPPAFVALPAVCARPWRADSDAGMLPEAETAAAAAAAAAATDEGDSRRSDAEADAVTPSGLTQAALDRCAPPPRRPRHGRLRLHLTRRIQRPPRRPRRARGLSSPAEVDRLFRIADTEDTGQLSFDEVCEALRQHLLFGKIRGGHYFVGITLAEAEGVRALLHARRASNQPLVPGSAASLALRHGTMQFEASAGFTPTTEYHCTTARQCFRLFDSEVDFTQREVHVALRTLQSNPMKRREEWV